jgi:hypothetical protein
MLHLRGAEEREECAFLSPTGRTVDCGLGGGIGLHR